MKVIGVSAACVLALCAVAVFDRVGAAGEEKPQAARTAVDLSGRWAYDREHSDDAREKLRSSREGRRGGRPPGGMGRRGGGGRSGPPPGGGRVDDDQREAMRAVLEPAEELAITQTGAEITIEEAYGRTRRLHPDGKTYKTENGVADIRTEWKDGKLVVETKRAGGSATETWELVADGKRILLNVSLRGGFGPSVELKRIYDRAPEEYSPASVPEVR